MTDGCRCPLDIHRVNRRSPRHLTRRHAHPFFGRSAQASQSPGELSTGRGPMSGHWPSPGPGSARHLRGHGPSADMAFNVSWRLRYAPTRSRIEASKSHSRSRLRLWTTSCPQLLLQLAIAHDTTPTRPTTPHYRSGRTYRQLRTHDFQPFRAHPHFQAPDNLCYQQLGLASRRSLHPLPRPGQSDRSTTFWSLLGDLTSFP